MKDSIIASLISQSSIHKCQQCGSFYKKKSHLYRHVRQKHTKTTNFPCTYINCNKSFKRNSHLKRHLITHTRARPYKCSSCIMAFGYKHHLDRHLKIKHLSQLPKCSTCSAEFNKKKTLAKHIKQNHPQTMNQEKIINNIVQQLRDDQIFDDESSIERMDGVMIKSQIHQKEKQREIQKVNYQQQIYLYKCPKIECLCAFTKTCSLKRHLKIHHDFTLGVSN